APHLPLDRAGSSGKCRRSHAQRYPRDECEVLRRTRWGRHRPKRVSAYTRKSVRKERPQRRPLLGVEGSSAPIWLAVHAVAIVVEPRSVIWLFATDLPTGRKRLHVVALCAACDCSLLLRTGCGGNSTLRPWVGRSKRLTLVPAMRPNPCPSRFITSAPASDPGNTLRSGAPLLTTTGSSRPPEGSKAEADTGEHLTAIRAHLDARFVLLSGRSGCRSWCRRTRPWRRALSSGRSARRPSHRS